MQLTFAHIHPASYAASSGKVYKMFKFVGKKKESKNRMSQ